MGEGEWVHTVALMSLSTIFHSYQEHDCELVVPFIRVLSLKYNASHDAYNITPSHIILTHLCQPVLIYIYTVCH